MREDLEFNVAHVFQEIYTGVQIFVYHCIDVKQAKIKFENIVHSPNNWRYIGTKISETL